MINYRIRPYQDYLSYRDTSANLVLKTIFQQSGRKLDDLAMSLGMPVDEVRQYFERKRFDRAVSHKLEEYFNIDIPSFFMYIQANHDDYLFERRYYAGPKPDLNVIRRVLFWDADFDHLHWADAARFVVPRVLDRGSDAEIAEIRRFYGEEVFLKYKQIYEDRLSNRKPFYTHAKI